jgi:tetratricopeptide (TPR) repeat protein
MHAEALARAVLGDRRRDDLALALLAQACNQLGKRDEAITMIRAAIGRNVKRADYHGLLGDILVTQGQFHEAIDAYDRALKHSPHHPGVLAGKANAYLRLDKTERALAVLEPLLKQGTEDAVIAIVHARIRMEQGDPHAAAEAVLSHLPAKREPLETRRTLYFTLGKAMEQAGEYTAAMEAYGEGNALSVSQFDAAAHAEKHDAIIEAFGAQAFESMPHSGCESRRPVFIVGMLRSGSTLTEQIIDAHSQGCGLGEIESMPRLINESLAGRGVAEAWSMLTQEDLASLANEYLMDAAGSADRMVDKQLGNYQLLGPIAKVFPKAAFIHCTRNPMAMGLSCFAQKLPPGTNPWAARLEDIGAFHRDYNRLMRHWREVLGDRILEVRYEDLVGDLPGTARRILDFCELPFEDDCLRFWETGRTVLTLSQDQVRRPLYDTAVSRHEPFGDLLAPLQSALGGV